MHGQHGLATSGARGDLNDDEEVDSVDLDLFSVRRTGVPADPDASGREVGRWGIWSPRLSIRLPRHISPREDSTDLMNLVRWVAYLFRGEVLEREDSTYQQRIDQQPGRNWPKFITETVSHPASLGGVHQRRASSWRASLGSRQVGASGPCRRGPGVVSVGQSFPCWPCERVEQGLALYTISTSVPRAK